ncbi:MAG: hypothetical protein K9G41_12410 [Flavobacteriales bacterium]|nr:hypothetical protein [Flavobacteriales bacterium]
MKKLDLHTGGHPFKNDNLMHVQSAYTEAFDALLSGVLETSLWFNLLPHYGFRLTGCEVTFSTTTTTNDTATWTAGWIVMGGEILQVDAGTLVRTQSYFRWAIVESTLGPDPQSYADGSTPDVHKVSKATIIQASIISAGMMEADNNTPYWKDIIHPKWKSYASVGLFTAQDDFGNPVTWTVSSYDYKYRVCNRMMEINLNVIVSTIAANATELRVRMPFPLAVECDGVNYGLGIFGNNELCTVESVPNQNYFRITKEPGAFTMGSVTLKIRFSLQVKES